jgi:hypothetical protein
VFERICEPVFRVLARNRFSEGRTYNIFTFTMKFKCQLLICLWICIVFVNERIVKIGKRCAAAYQREGNDALECTHKSLDDHLRRFCEGRTSNWTNGPQSLVLYAARLLIQLRRIHSLRTAVPKGCEYTWEITKEAPTCL